MRNLIFLQFYQDTLEIEEDKDQREKDNGEEESKKDKELVILDDEKDNRDDDDSRSNSKYFIIIFNSLSRKKFPLKNYTAYKNIIKLRSL